MHEYTVLGYKDFQNCNIRIHSMNMMDRDCFLIFDVEEHAIED